MNDVKPSGGARDEAPKTRRKGGGMRDFPSCYGHKIRRSMDDKCTACQWLESCHYYSYSNKAEKSRRVHFMNFQEMPFSRVEARKVERGLEAAYEARRDSFYMPDGRRIDISGVNIELAKIYIWLTLEFPATMRALALKLDPSVRSLEDMAAIMHTSRQLLHQRIARECGVGSNPDRAKKTGRRIAPAKTDEQKHARE